MAVKSTDTKSTADATKADPAPVEAEPARTVRADGQCVIDAPLHVGRAVNGLVCSYHAMHYRADGSRR